MSLRLLTVLALVGAPLVATADSPKIEARQHVARATELHKAGQFEDALLELKTAYALDPQPQLLFAMGQLHVRLGQCGQAISFYERFLATRPSRDTASLANEAIETCRTAPPEPAPVLAPIPVGAHVAPPSIDVSPPAAPVAERPAPARSTPPREPAPWYSNYVAGGLVAGGVASGVAALVVYSIARRDRDRADTITDYEAYEHAIDGVQTKQTFSIVLGVAAAALITTGGIQYWRSHRREHDRGVQVAPTRGGGMVTWSGGF